MVRYPQTERALEQAGRTLRQRGYSARTQATYLRWMRRFLAWAGHPHPDALGRGHLEGFQSHLTDDLGLAAKTRNLAASALTFLYREVLGSEAGGEVRRARGASRVPVVLSHREAMAVLGELHGRKYLVAALLYGTGMRLLEALQLRVKDLDFELGRVEVRAGKGGKDRVVMLPQALMPDLRRLIRLVARRHEADRRAGNGWAPLPGALARKKPDEGWSLGWQYLFQATRQSTDPLTDRLGRAFLHPSAVQRAVRTAVRRAGILKPATCHTFRHSFATQMLRDGYDIRVVQELLGHKDVRTTMLYLHVVDQLAPAVRSPLDRERPGPRPDFSG